MLRTAKFILRTLAMQLDPLKGDTGAVRLPAEKRAMYHHWEP